MKCSAIRKLMSRGIDGELSEAESRALGEHLGQCPDCARAWGLLRVPRLLASRIAPVEPSPYFYRKLERSIENEARNVAVLQQFFGLARRVIPSMAAITLALVSVFAYLQLSGPQDDLHTAYERVFLGENLPLPSMIAGKTPITDASILSAIANRKAWQNPGYELK